MPTNDIMSEILKNEAAEVEKLIRALSSSTDISSFSKQLSEITSSANTSSAAIGKLIKQVIDLNIAVRSARPMPAIQNTEFQSQTPLRRILPNKTLNFPMGVFDLYRGSEQVNMYRLMSKPVSYSERTGTDRYPSVTGFQSQFKPITQSADASRLIALMQERDARTMADPYNRELFPKPNGDYFSRRYSSSLNMMGAAEVSPDSLPLLQRAARNAAEKLVAQQIPNVGGTSASVEADVFDNLPTKTTPAERAAAREVERQKRIPVYQDIMTSMDLPQESQDRISGFLERTGGKLDKSNLSRVKTHEPLGITDMTFSKFDNNERVLREMTLTVDRFGNVIQKTSRHLQGFGEAVGRDILEFMKWSVAVALVLGPLQKVGELVNEMIANQQKLADITIILNKAQQDGNEIFSAAAQISQKTGESMGGVLDAYTIAYRATGSVSDANERFVQTNQLLTDSLILSKLSSLDQAESIDTLAAALLQSGRSYGQGIELLNKWVAVSKIANVDVATLATGFAVMGDAAESAGLSVDEINGLIASISATGISSPKEAANTAKAIVGGFSSDKARNELQSLGVSIEDTEGKAKSFNSIMAEVAGMRKTGVLNEGQFKDLTLALGGGTRRAGPWATFLDNYDMVEQIAKTSAAASATSGEAMAALQTQTDTVATSVVRLSNAFSFLAQTLGTKGGLLDGFKLLLDAGTGLVGILDKLAGGAGRSFLPLLAAGGLSLLTSSKGSLWTNSMISRGTGALGSSAGWLTGNSSILSGMVGRSYGYQTMEGSNRAFGFTPQTKGEYASEGTQTWLNKNSNKVASGMVIAVSVAGNLFDSTSTGTEKSVRIGADIAGGIAGAFVGGPMGAAVGASIAESFANSVLLYKPQFSNLFSSSFGGDGAAPKTSEMTEQEKELEDTRKETLNKIYEGASTAGIGVAGSKRLDGQIRSTLLSYAMSLGGSNVTSEDAGLLLATGFGTNKKKQAEIAALVSKQNLLAAQTGVAGGAETPEFMKLRDATESRDAATIEKVKRELEDTIRGQLISGTMSPSEYKNSMDNIGKTNVTSSKYYTAFGNQFGSRTGRNQEETYKTFGNIATFASAEEKNLMNAITDEVANAQSAMNQLTVGTSEYNAQQEIYNTKVAEAITLTSKLNEVINSRVNIPSTLNLDGLSNSEVNMVMEEARKTQATLDASRQDTGIFRDKEQLMAYESAIPKTFIKGKEGYSYQGGAEQGVIQDTINRLTQEGLINQPNENKNIGFQSYDMTRSEYDSAIGGPQGYDYWKNLLKGMGVNVQEDEMALLFKDGNLKDRKDWKIVQFLMQKVIANQEKAMEIQGVYNMPEGMDAIVHLDDILAKVADAITGTTTGNTMSGIGASGGGNAGGLLRGKQGWGTSSVEGDKEPWRVAMLGPNKPWTPTPQGPGINLSGLMRGAGGIASDLSNNLSKNLSAKLSLSIDNRTTLTVDGRQLANIVKRYMKEDLVRFGSAGGSTTRVSII